MSSPASSVKLYLQASTLGMLPSLEAPWPVSQEIRKMQNSEILKNFPKHSGDPETQALKAKIRSEAHSRKTPKRLDLQRENLLDVPQSPPPIVRKYR